MKKVIMISIMLATTACANLGDGKFNPEFTPEFKEVYHEVQPLLLDIGTVLFFENPALAQDLVTKLTRAKSNVTDFTQTYSLPEAVDKTKQYLLDECKYWCYLTSTRSYVVRAGQYLDELKQVQTVEQFTVPQIIDQLILALSNPQLPE